MKQILVLAITLFANLVVAGQGNVGSPTVGNLIRMDGIHYWVINVETKSRQDQGYTELKWRDSLGTARVYTGNAVSTEVEYLLHDIRSEEKEFKNCVEYIDQFKNLIFSTCNMKIQKL